MVNIIVAFACVDCEFVAFVCIVFTYYSVIARTRIYRGIIAVKSVNGIVTLTTAN